MIRSDHLAIPKGLALLAAMLLVSAPSSGEAQPVATSSGERAVARAPTPEGVLAPGTRWETEYFVIRGAKVGPTVLVLAGQHGDEPAGPVAADRLVRWSLRRGKLVVVPRTNRPALAQKKRFSPGTRHPDLARNFPRFDGDPPRGQLATALWQFLQSTNPDILLDLHEGFSFHRRTKRSIGSTILYTPLPGAERHVQAMVDAVDGTISDQSKKFSLIPKPIVGSVIDAGWKRLGIPCIVQETTKVGQPMELRVSQHLLMTRTLLTRLGMVGAGPS